MDFKKTKGFLKLMKWRFYFTTIQIVVGYLLVIWPNFSLNDFYKLISLFIIFGPLLHGGIYTLNDIFDLEEDKKHPVKRKRPLASGQIKIHEAYIFSITLITTAFAFSYIVDISLVIVCSLFLIINLLYSSIFKKIPYLEIMINTITHPLRFYTGVIAAGAFNFHGIAFLIALFAFGIAVLKRKKEIIERQKKSRKVLRYYTNNSLRNLIIIVNILIFIKIIISKNLDFYFGIIILILYFVTSVGYHKVPAIQKLMDKWY